MTPQEFSDFRRLIEAQVIDAGKFILPFHPGSPIPTNAQRLEFFNFLMRMNGPPPPPGSPEVLLALRAAQMEITRELAFGTSGTAQ